MDSPKVCRRHRYGHIKEAHEHYSTATSSYCGFCYCPRYTRWPFWRRNA